MNATIPTFSVPAVATLLAVKGLALPELAVWKNKRTGSIVVNAGYDYTAAEDILLAAGYRLTHVSLDLIAIAR